MQMITLRPVFIGDDPIGPGARKSKIEGRIGEQIIDIISTPDQ